MLFFRLSPDFIGRYILICRMVEDIGHLLSAVWGTWFLYTDCGGKLCLVGPGFFPSQRHNSFVAAGYRPIACIAPPPHSDLPRDPYCACLTLRGGMRLLLRFPGGMHCLISLIFRSNGRICFYLGPVMPQVSVKFYTANLIVGTYNFLSSIFRLRAEQSNSRATHNPRLNLTYAN